MSKTKTSEVIVRCNQGPYHIDFTAKRIGKICLRERLNRQERQQRHDGDEAHEALWLAMTAGDGEAAEAAMNAAGGVFRDMGDDALDDVAKWISSEHQVSIGERITKKSLADRLGCELSKRSGERDYVDDDDRFWGHSAAIKGDLAYRKTSDDEILVYRLTDADPFWVCEVYLGDAEKAEISRIAETPRGRMMLMKLAM